MIIATVGTSWITESFISACFYSGGVNVRYCYSRDLEKAKAFCEKTHCEGYTNSFDTIANDSEINAVYIASPNVCHYEQSRYFLSRGKSVLCEKPATTTLYEFNELKALAREKGVYYAEAIMSLHTPAFDTLVSAIGEIGTVRSALINYCQLSSKYPLYLKGGNPNIFNPDMHAGCLMDIGVYNLYLAAGLFGMPEKIISDARLLDSGADACGSAILTYPDKTVTLNYSKVSQGYSQSEIYGDKGTVYIDAVSQLTGIGINTKDRKKELVSSELSRDEVMSGEINFFKALLSGDECARKKYYFVQETAAAVRTVCDEIRKQNGFPF